MAEIQQQQYDAASAVVNQYAGKDLGQLSSDDKATLAQNLAIMARYNDTSSVYGNANFVMQHLSELFAQGKIPTNLDTFFSSVPLPPPASLSKGQVDKVLENIGNAWFTPSALGKFRINQQDLFNALKEIQVISAEGEFKNAQMFIQAKMDEAQAIKDSAKKDAEMAKWAMIGAIVGIGVGIAGAAAGGLAKGLGGGGLSGFGSGFAGGLETATRIGDTTGKILENGAKVGLLIDKGTIDANRVEAEAASSLAQKAMQTNKEMGDSAASQIDEMLRA